MSDHYDIIIIGTGAGGGTLAYKLAPSGKRILLLERGDYVPREKDNWNPRAVNAEGKYQTKEVWRDRDGKDLHPHTNYYVGGNTKFFGAALFRLCEEDFGQLRHKSGISPAWPISYEELEPYYSQAEQLYQVHGQRGEDPTEPSASSPYPHPPVSHEPRMQQLSDDFARLGLSPSPVWEYPMGHISFVGKLDRDTLKAGAPALVPGFTLDLMAAHSLDFWLTSEDLPDPNNRVTLDHNGNIILAYTPNNDAGHRRLISTLESLMQQQTKCTVHDHACHQGLFARNLFVGQRIPLAGVAHQNRTIRFGRDPKTSVLDPHCKTHELDNLYVVDGSFFPSSGAVNPALTIMANALRVGDHLLERLG